MLFRKHMVLFISLLVSSWLGATAASAESFWVEVPVLDVQPLVRIVEVTQPQEVCWEEQVRETGYAKRKSHTPKILGGLIGGAVGSTFGGGRGQDIMTIAGALLGASIGNDVSRQQRGYGHDRVRVEQFCEIEQVTHQEERVDGYLVTYEFNDRALKVRRDTDPGETMRVRVSVEAVGYNLPSMSGQQFDRAPGYRQRHKS